jgi:hypothetical protein
MRFTREQAVMALSAPVMLAGLAAAALGQGWPTRLGAAAMVLGSALVLGLTGRGARRAGWTMAALGAVAVVTGCL